MKIKSINADIVEFKNSRELWLKKNDRLDAEQKVWDLCQYHTWYVSLNHRCFYHSTNNRKTKWWIAKLVGNTGRCTKFFINVRNIVCMYTENYFENWILMSIVNFYSYKGTVVKSPLTKRGSPDYNEKIKLAVEISCWVSQLTCRSEQVIDFSCFRSVMILLQVNVCRLHL